MWIQVRSMDGKKLIQVDGLSKLTKIEELREKLVEPFEAPTTQQKLFYRGKILVDGHSLFDYDVGLNAIVQLLVSKATITITERSDDEDDKKEKAESSSEEENVDKENMAPRVVVKESCEPTSSQDSGIGNEASTYKVGDIIDARDEEMGAWFEAKIMKVTLNDQVKLETPENNSEVEDQSKVKQEITEIEKIDQNANEKLEDGKPEEKAEQMETELTCDEKKDKSEENSVNVQEKAGDSNKGVNACIPAKSDIKTVLDSAQENDGYTYHVVFEGYEDDEIVKLTAKNLRPRARNVIKFDNIKEGDRVMVNHNYDEPDCRGYWYDGVVTGKRNTRTIKELRATVYVGKDLIPMENCLILFRDEVFAIEKPGTQLNVNRAAEAALTPVKRTNKPECDHCMDNPRRKCKHCACSKCGDKKDPDKQILCDECDQAYHIYCLSPPLDAIPEDDEWYCPECKNDASEVVGAGQKLKESKKKSKMASATNQTSRDWGKGMACVGRTKQCTIVPSNHFGPIPGIEVGTLWLYRVQVSEAGVHRPHVAGIHGREEEGAYSIALSGGYEDDHDEGERFYYTGSGGRDLSGNKRTAEQSCDQTLTRFNKALARNCAAPLNGQDGADAGKDWRKGKPVRVVRNAKLSKHSKYAPDEGNRYDGIYKVKKYWSEKGKSGFKVWRFLFQRDDTTSAPWTKEGKKRVEELGLAMQYPEGHEEMMAKKEKERKEKEKEKTPAGKGKRGKRKRTIDSDSDEEEEAKVSPKRVKKAAYKVAKDVMENIKKDEQNEKVWEEALGHTKEGAQDFLAKVEELFCCICCQDLAYRPITTSCSHNICKTCLQRSFKAEVYSCPACRTELDQNMDLSENSALRAALKALFPGYENGR